MSPLPLSNPARILLVDDHTIVRHAVRTILDASGRYQVIGEAGTADEAIETARNGKPQFVLVDLGLPGKSGIEFIFELHQEGSAARILILTMHEDEARVRQAFDAGARGYLLKSSSSAELLEALDTVADGGIYLAPRFAHLKGEVLAREAKGPPTSPTDPLGLLSRREREVFYLLADGMPNRLIARKLFISPRTVETHRARVIRKLGFQSTAELIRFAIRNNLLTL